MYYTCHKNKKKKAFYIFQKTYLNQKIIEFMELKCFYAPIWTDTRDFQALKLILIKQL